MYPNIRCLHKNGGDSTVAEKNKRRNQKDAPTKKTDKW